MKCRYCGVEITQAQAVNQHELCDTHYELDEKLARRMMTRFKELRREQPGKHRPDIEWMLCLLMEVRANDWNHATEEPYNER